MLLVLNAHHDLVEFTLPAYAEGKSWQRLVDTNVPEDDHEPAFAPGDAYGITGRSLLLFVLS
jgi:glycogen operon protein